MYFFIIFFIVTNCFISGNAMLLFINMIDDICKILELQDIQFSII